MHATDMMPVTCSCMISRVKFDDSVKLNQSVTLMSCMQIPEDNPRLCISGILGGASREFIVLDDTFLRKYYSIYAANADGSNARIGLGVAVAQ